jgi:PAS domain-containing protein
LRCSVTRWRSFPALLVREGIGGRERPILLWCVVAGLGGAVMAAWRELVIRRPEEDPPVPELGMSVLPGSVVASHLEASAAGLVDGTTAARVDACVGTAGELAAIIDNLVEGQRHIRTTLGQLADYVRVRKVDGALTEVLRAAAEAVGYSADALAEGLPLMQVVLDVTGEDTRL